MMVQVWLICKKGEPRIYTRTTEPPDDLAKKWREDGYKLYRAELFIPFEHTTRVDGIITKGVEEV